MFDNYGAVGGIFRVESFPVAAGSFLRLILLLGVLFLVSVPFACHLMGKNKVLCSGIQEWTFKLHTKNAHHFIKTRANFTHNLWLFAV